MVTVYLEIVSALALTILALMAVSFLIDRPAPARNVPIPSQWLEEAYQTEYLLDKAATILERPGND